MTGPIAEKLHPSCAVVPGTDGIYVYIGIAKRTFRLDRSLARVLKAVDVQDKAALERLEASFGSQWEQLFNRLRNEEIVVDAHRKPWRVGARRASYRIAYLLPLAWAAGIAAAIAALFELPTIRSVVAEIALPPLWLPWFLVLGPPFIAAHEVSHALCLSLIGGRAGRMRLQRAWPPVYIEIGPIQQAPRGRAVLVVSAGALTEAGLLGAALFVLASRPPMTLAALTLASATWLGFSLALNMVPFLRDSDGQKLRALLALAKRGSDPDRETPTDAVTQAAGETAELADEVAGDVATERLPETGKSVNQPRVVTSVEGATGTAGAVLAQLISVTKRFGPTTALENVSLDVRAGEIVALLGPNGAGKTTALRLMLGLRRADSGLARLFRQDPRNWQARQLIGVTPQETDFPGTLRVQELVDLVQIHYADPLPGPELLEQFGLAGLERRQAGGLSGGQRRRLAVALAFLGRPKAVFLDEPTAGLDVASRRHLIDAVRAYVAAGGTVLLTTHDLREVEELASRVVVIHRGRILAEGSVSEIRARAGLTRVQLRADHIPPVTGVERTEQRGGVQTLFVRDAADVVRQLVLADVPLDDLEVRPSSLEEVFLAMTRDET